MKKITLALASTLLLTTLTLSAENACSDSELSWTQKKQFTHLGSTDLLSVFIDTKNIKIDKKDKIIEVWVIYVASKIYVARTIKNYGNKYENYGYLKALKRFNYSKNNTNLKDYTNLNCDGSLIKESMTKSNEWSDIQPGSMDEGVMDDIVKKYNLQ